jgi:hypothetical protein
MSGKPSNLGGPISETQRNQLEFNVARMCAHHAKTREEPVWLRTEFDGHEWRTLEVVEHFEGLDKLRIQFLQHPSQLLAPGVRGKGILIGPRMPDDSIYAGEGVAVPQKAKAAPKAKTDTTWSAWRARREAATAPAIAPPAPEPLSDKIAITIAKAKAAIARGVSREAVLKVLRAAGIVNPEI